MRSILLGMVTLALGLGGPGDAQARSDGLDLLTAAALGVSTLGAPIGLGLSLARRERVTDVQLFGGYLFGAADLGIGVWTAADSEFGSAAQRSAAAVPAMAVAAVTLSLTVLAHLRRSPPGTPAAAPWGEVVDGFIRNTGLIVGSVAMVANGENKAWLGATGLALFGLVMDLRRAVQLASVITLPPPPGWTFAPQLFESPGGRLAAGALLRFAVK